MSALRSNPYVGLRPFFSRDSLYFFGREQQTAELLEILHLHRFLGVVGSSGSGKSSLVRAGLLPSLLAGFLVEDRDHWHTVQIKPGDTPLGNLASGFVAAMDENANQAESEKLEQAIREGHTDAVIEYLDTRMKGNDNLFLLVDQFEEIFAFRGIREEDEGHLKLDSARLRERARRKAEADDFVDLLIALGAQRKLPIYVTLTMRTDFLGDCDLFYGLPEALNQGRYLVPRMTRRQMRDAIECPAILKGAKIAPRLLDCVLNEVGDRFDRLPVLQHALLRTWDAWLNSGGAGPIEMRHYTTAGELEHALDQDAEIALKGLDIGICARIFKRLTDTDNSQRRVRSPARFSDLMATTGAERDTVEEIVTRFEEGGRSFVHSSPDGKPDDPRVDISHESLIRQWARLRGWVDEERQWRDRYIDLVIRARGRERKGEALLWPPSLDVVMDWKEEADPMPGWAKNYSVADDDFDCAMGYLDESIKVRCDYLAKNELQRRWQKFWNPLIIVLVIAAGVAAEQSDFIEEQSTSIMIDKGWMDPPSSDGTASPELINCPTFAEITTSVGDAAEGVIEGDDSDSDRDRAETETETETEKKAKAAERELTKKCQKQAISEFRRKVTQEFFQYGYLVFFFAIYFALGVAGKRLHRRFVLPRILRRFIEFGGRIPVESEPAELQDAIVVHKTTYASTIRRIGGYMVDNTIFQIVSAGLTVAAFTSFANNDYEYPEALLIGSGLFLLIFAWMYETFQITSKRQATLGMRAIGIFRTDLNGQRLSLKRATAWWLLRFISYLFIGLGFVIQPFTKKRQTFHDWAARTVVLHGRAPEAARPKRPRSRIAKIMIFLMWIVVITMSVGQVITIISSLFS